MNITELLKQPRDMRTGCADTFPGGVFHPVSIGWLHCFDDRGLLKPAIQFGGCLEAEGLTLADTDEPVVDRFGRHDCNCSGSRTQKGISRAYTSRVQSFVDYLRQNVAIKALAVSKVEIPATLCAFRDWLLRHRGLAPIAVERHERLIMRMLPSLGTNTSSHGAASVKRVVMDQISDCRAAHTKTIVGALRLYLRFLATSGASQPGLDHILPTGGLGEISRRSAEDFLVATPTASPSPINGYSP